MTEIAPYGSWRSPLSAAEVAEAGSPIADVQFSGRSVFWLQRRPKEGGRTVLMRHDEDGTLSDVTPDGFNVRTKVHEYGGGSMLVDDSRVFFANFSDQRLYRQGDGGEPRPITPEPPEPASIRYADMRVTPDGRWLVCVRERHEPDGVVNELAILPDDGSAEPRTLAGGHDFFSNPRVSPDGTQLAWLSWDHPRMPWDGTELSVASFDPERGLGEARVVAGGPEESIAQPEWSPDGVLHFVSDRTGWWNLYRAEPDRDLPREVTPLAPLDAEFALPAWVFGISRYAFLSGGRIACAFDQRGASHLALLERGKPLRDLELAIDASCLRSDGRRLLMIGLTASEFPAVYALDPAGGEPEVLYRTRERSLDHPFLSTAQPIEFPTEENRTAHAFFYPPRNPDYSAPDGERPPLIVHSHGGPTAAVTDDLDLEVQYWTTRGIGVVDVNYGGSTGYGREYRDRLRGRWGEVDLADCVNAARFLADRGDVDGSRMAIAGGSAGGYTTLSALTFTDVFAAGASYYGVGDLEALARDTHKFESRYLDGLVGPYPQEVERYRERSPVHFTEKLSCPVILFQGLEDEVVPPEQAEEMVRSLQEKSLPYAYLAFGSEQHGFRRAETIVRTLEAELYFYSRIFGFELADPVEPVAIENL
ncbi:MAG: S9 family peptidase [Actinomycetota bacterium]